ncbi:MAG: thioredoxin family protein [Pirellulaceae bacterium]
MLVSCFVVAAVAGEYNPTLSVGDRAPAWNKIDGTDGKPHSLDDLKSFEIIVVYFTSNTCPYAIDYDNRVNNLVKEFQQHNIAVVAINSNQGDAESLESMKKHALDAKFQHVYLKDESQSIAKSYGATYTPEFFVINKDRKIVYMGALDDSSDPQKVQIHYAANAIQGLLADHSIEVTETPAVGCTIRYKRTRRQK